MKRLIVILFFTLVIFTSCYRINYKAHVVYDVCWPDTTIQYDTIVNCIYIGDVISDNILNLDTTFMTRIYSYKGSNCIQIKPGNNFIMETTAPIRLYYFKRIK